MVWKLNDPFEVSVSGILTDIPPVFDGKNVWVATSSGVTCLEYWGPYHDDDVNNNDSSPRWQENETDILTLNSLPNKLRVLFSVAQTGITSMIPGRTVLILSTATQIIAINFVTGAKSTLGTFPVGLVKNSNLVYNGLFTIFFVEQMPTTQTINDNQQLWGLNYSTGDFISYGLIPGVKQSAVRDLVISNDILYISCMNTRQVHKYNALTGGYLTSVIINRDVEKLYRVDNDVTIISSMRGKSTIGEVEYATSMVSQLTVSDTVNHLYGILTAGKYLADAGDYVWFVNDSNLIQRTKKSNNSSFMSDGTGPVTKAKNADFCIDTTADGMVNGVQGTITVSGIKNILCTPSLTYQYWTGSAFVDVTVPRYLFLIKSGSVISVRLPGALKWINNVTLNQYSALSTGGLGYKQG